jgi:hypothetical protein
MTLRVASFLRVPPIDFPPLVRSLAAGPAIVDGLFARSAGRRRSFGNVTRETSTHCLWCLMGRTTDHSCRRVIKMSTKPACALLTLVSVCAVALVSCDGSPSIAFGGSSAQESPVGAKVRDLTQSDLVKDLRSAKLGGIIPQISDGGLFAVGEHEIVVFDSTGTRIGKLSVPVEGPGRREPAGATEILPPPQRVFKMTSDRAYLSVGNRVLIWSLPAAQPAKVLTFDGSVRLIEALDDRLILASEGSDTDTLITVSTLDGEVIQAFGSKLAWPETPYNRIANSFFSFYDAGRVVIVFRVYPVFRVYDLEGNLLREGKYQVPRQVEFLRGDDNPPFEALPQVDEQTQPSYQILNHLKFWNGQAFVAFNANCMIGVWDMDFRLLYSKDLWSFENGGPPPLVADFDPPNNRVLVMHTDRSAFGSAFDPARFLEKSTYRFLPISGELSARATPGSAADSRFVVPN